MIFVLIFLAGILLLVCLMVNENNAKYILAGYNAMSKEDREKVELKGFLKLFRRFHVFLALSVFIAGALLHYFVDENSAGLFLIFYPLAAYMYLLWKANQFTDSKEKANTVTGILFIFISIVFVGVLLIPDVWDNEITLNKNYLEIHGRYGEKISLQQVSEVKVSKNLPEIKVRSNGVSMGNIKKGFFKTSSGERVKLIVNTPEQPYLEIIKKDGSRLFFNSKKSSSQEIFQSINDSLLKENQ
jgi:hypothetical protein